jgi:hypothetical protein
MYVRGHAAPSVRLSKEALSVSIVVRRGFVGMAPFRWEVHRAETAASIFVHPIASSAWRRPTPQEWPGWQSSFRHARPAASAGADRPVAPLSP